MGVADEVEHRQARLGLVETESPTELLQEHRSAYSSSVRLGSSASQAGSRGDIGERIDGGSGAVGFARILLAWLRNGHYRIMNAEGVLQNAAAPRNLGQPRGAGVRCPSISPTMPPGPPPPAQDALLRFRDHHLESQFRAELATQGRSIRIAALGFAVLLILTMGWLDPMFVSPAALRAELLVRYAILAPIPAAGMLLIWRAEAAGPRYHPLMAGLAMAIGLVFSVQLWVGGPEASQYYFPAIVMGFLFGQFLVGLTFAHSLPVTSVSVALYCLVCFGVGSGAATLIYVAVMLIAISGISTYAAYQFEHALRSSFVTARAVGIERDQYDALLGQILPDSVRARLSAGEQNVADTHAEVSVMFIDLVGFADLSRRLTAPHLVEVLDLVFKRLDELSDRHGVERIKTIGDCYMCAAGLHSNRPAVGSSVLDMGIEAVEAVHAVGREQGLGLSVRVGIATGPAVSGVLGSKRPHFDVWGETVNLASRMQVRSAANRVHVDERTRHRYLAQFEFEAREPLEIRGLGRAETYFVLHRRTEHDPADVP